MLLELKNVTVPTIDQQCVIVNNVSFGVKEGSIHAIIGPNGSGKSTLAYTIMGLSTYQISQGKIYFDGIDITNLNITERAKLGITLAWQEPARIDGLSVFKYITLGIKEKTNLKEKVREALQIVNLEPERYYNRIIDDTLSGGERKRVELAAAVAMKPRLLILDEIEAGLDFIVLDDFMNIFEKVKNLNITIILITHREDIGIVADYGTLLWRGETLLTEEFPKVMLKYCVKAGLKEFCKRTLLKDGEKCFDDDYIEKFFREEESS